MRQKLTKAMLCTLMLTTCLSLSAFASEGETQASTESTTESTAQAPSPAEGEAPAPADAASVTPTATPALPGSASPLLTPAPGFTPTGEKDPDICAHLGEDYYLLTISPEKGNIFANANGRTFCPSTQMMGHYIGYTLTGQALISDDSYSIADILGPEYSLLAYTPDRGNCYVNGQNQTYTPATNEVGLVTGRNEDGLPIITITGLMVPITNYAIYSNPGEVTPVEGQTIGGPVPDQSTQQPPAQEAAQGQVQTEVGSSQ